MDNINTIITAVSIAGISEILGIIVTSILIVYWLLILGLKVYQIAKDGKLDSDELEELKDVTEETEKQLDKLTDKTDDGGNE